MKLFKKFLLLSLFLFFIVKGFTQHSVNTTGDSFMEQNGKIYVVMAVAVVIVLGLFLYLLNLDKKITRLEKRKE